MVCNGEGAVRRTSHGGRTWFDPVTELPRLQRWLHDNRHPSRTDMARYAHELNSSPHRRRRSAHRPLDVNNIAYWFKNARARALARVSPVKHADRGHAAAVDAVSYTHLTLPTNLRV